MSDNQKIKGGTPLIVYTDFKSFDDYIKSLDKPARKNYRYAKKHNQDLTYKEVPFDKPLVERFMNVWAQQTIHGNEPVNWGFDISHVVNLNERGVLRTFVAYKEEPIAVHFVEKHDNYVECHPPMYDKIHNDRYLAKYMWFNLIEWAINTDVDFLDLGSGDRGNWRELLINRHKYPRIAYKWMYIPKYVKDNPQEQPEYLVYNEYGRKFIR